MSIATRIDRLLPLMPDGHIATEIVLSSDGMADLIDDATTDVTLTGDTVPILRSYERDYLDLLVWHDALSESGRPARAWQITPDVTAHLREIKRERGLRLYRGIPLRVDPESQALSIHWGPIFEILVRSAA